MVVADREGEGEGEDGGCGAGALSRRVWSSAIRARWSEMCWMGWRCVSWPAGLREKTRFEDAR